MVISMGTLIENSQIRLQKSLKANADFNISLKETQKILEKFLGFKIKLVILNIDLMGSTKMSLDLPMDKLTTIIRSFAQEFSIIISNYGGYVLKYIGDAVLAFFVFEDSSNKNKKNIIEIDIDDGSLLIRS
jgi:adenylate cyclase